jgi:HSP20 family molecular chaperone IbpA
MLAVTRVSFERLPLTDIGRELEALSADLRQFMAYLVANDANGPFGAEYRPTLDVIETASAIEIVADLPGVTIDAVRVVFSDSAVIIAGRKQAAACEHRDATFHLAERTFGRFVCIVRLGAAVDAGRAKATLGSGELTIVLPRVEDRRGRDLAIAIESAR